MNSWWILELCREIAKTDNKDDLKSAISKLHQSKYLTNSAYTKFAYHPSATSPSDASDPISPRGYSQPDWQDTNSVEQNLNHPSATSPSAASDPISPRGYSQLDGQDTNSVEQKKSEDSSEESIKEDLKNLNDLSSKRMLSLLRKIDFWNISA